MNRNLVKANVSACGDILLNGSALKQKMPSPAMYIARTEQNNTELKSYTSHELLECIKHFPAVCIDQLLLPMNSVLVVGRK